MKLSRTPGRRGGGANFPTTQGTETPPGAAQSQKIVVNTLLQMIDGVTCGSFGNVIVRGMLSYRKYLFYNISHFYI